jgi:NTE family protein
MTAAARRRSIRRTARGTVAALLLAGCATTLPPGQPLSAVAAADGYRFDSAAAARHGDDLLLMVAFSGGGTRAAALAYGVLEQMSTDRGSATEPRVRLSDRIDAISSVSGGTLTAAYFTLHGDGLFRDFRREFLERDVEADLWRELLARPGNWRRLGTDRYGRGDLLADYLDRRLFRGATFEALRRPDAPFLAINATDLGAGGRFEFTQQWFDALCIDLVRYPLARAAAASAAYPMVITPVALENRAGRCGYAVPVVVDDPADRQAAWLARLAAYQDTARHRYLHLADGGLSDNLGLRALIDVLAGAHDFEHARQTMRLPPTRRFAVVIVNASSTAGERIARSGSAPGVLEMASLSGSALVDLYADENRAVLREQLRRLGADAARPGSRAPQTYWIEVDLRRIADRVLRDRLRAVPTGFTVPPGDVADLIAVGRQLLADDRDYRRLLQDLATESIAPDGQ